MWFLIVVLAVGGHMQNAFEQPYGANINLCMHEAYHQVMLHQNEPAIVYCKNKDTGESIEAIR